MDMCKVSLIGNVGRDPENRFTTNGTQVLSFSVACNRLGPPAMAGAEREKVTEWFTITCFGKLAEVYANVVTKGNRVFIEGRLQSRKYTRNDGTNGFSMEVIANELHVFARQPRGDDMDMPMDSPVGAGASMGGRRSAPMADADAQDIDDVPF